MRRFRTSRRSPTTDSYALSRRTPRSRRASTCSTARSRTRRSRKPTASSTRRSTTCCRSLRLNASAGHAAQPQQPDAGERERQPAERSHLGGVLPGANDLYDRRAWIDPLDRPEQQARLRCLVDHDAVARAPPQLERNAGECELTRIVDRAPVRPCIARDARDAAELEARQLLQPGTVTALREHRIPGRHVRGRVERDGARKQMRVCREEEQRLLAAHASAHRVHATSCDMQPGAGALARRGHSSVVRNLAWTSPRIQLEASALTLGVDDGEVSERRQVAPPCLLYTSDAADEEDSVDLGGRRII